MIPADAARIGTEETPLPPATPTTNRPGRRRRLAMAPIAVALAVLLTACNGLVDQKAIYTTSGTTTITGTAPTISGDALVGVTVNGLPATLNGNKYQLGMTLSGTSVFNPVLVKATYASGHVETDRGTIAYGDGTHATIVPVSGAVTSGVALRLNQQAFAKLGPVVQSLTTIDTSSITPVGTQVLDDCVLPGLFGLCITRATAKIDRAPTLSGFDVNLISHNGSTEADVTLHNLDVFSNVKTVTGGIIPIGCELNIHANSVLIKGNYVLKPDPANPDTLRVDMQGSPTVSLGGVSHDWVSGVCSLPLIDSAVDMLMPNVSDLLQSNLTTALSDPDGSGPAQSPIAKAIQQSLAQVHIAGPIGDSLGVTLDAPLHGVTQDSNGVGLTANSHFLANEVAPGAPAQAASLGFGQSAVADPGATAPGGVPYDVAVGASITSFNQLLAAETDRGLLNITTTEMNGAPITFNGLLGQPAGGPLMKLVLTPELAPAITTAAAPSGSIGMMHLAGYRVDIKYLDSGQEFLGLALDFDAPVNLSASNGQLGFVMGAPADGTVHVDIVKNPLGLPESLVQTSFAALGPTMFSSLGSLLPAFPLPALVGLTLSPIATARVGDSLFLYANFG